MWIFDIGSSAVFAAVLRAELYDGLVLTPLVQKNTNTQSSAKLSFITLLQIWVPGLIHISTPSNLSICLAGSDLLVYKSRLGENDDNSTPRRPVWKAFEYIYPQIKAESQNFANIHYFQLNNNIFAKYLQTLLYTLSVSCNKMLNK